MTIVAKVEIPSRNSNEKKRKMMLCQKQVKEKEQELKARIEREAKLSQDEKTELKSQAVALKKAGNELYLSGANTEAIDKYNEALDTCPLDFKEDRFVVCRAHS